MWSIRITMPDRNCSGPSPRAQVVCYSETMEPSSPLRREVLDPGPGPTARGLVAVSAAAMMLALTSSAMLFWATLPNSRTAYETRCFATQRSAVSTQLHVIPTAAVPQRGHGQPLCGTPIYHSRPDGSTEVEFEACPGTTVESTGSE